VPIVTSIGSYVRLAVIRRGACGRRHSMGDLMQLRRRFDEEIVNGHNLDAIPKWFASDFVDHVEIPGMPPGVEGVTARHAMLFTAMPDIHIDIHDVLASGDTAAARFTITGTDSGGFMGMPATGKRVAVTGMDFMRFRDGLIVEHWGEMDMLGMLQQLGVIPT
jgi:steroid delta-isomerase-like uncharacterized protein